MTTLKAALQEACFMELGDIPSEEELSADESLTFSAAFERKMKKLIRRADHPIRYRVAQAAACILLAALLSGCAVLAISPEARSAFVGWIREVNETWFVYRFEGESNDVTSETQYRPTWLPEGYSQSLVRESEDVVNVLYASDAGPMVIFAYSNSASSLNLIPQGEIEFFKVMVNDTPADFYLDNDTTKANCLVWESPENDLIYWITANLPMDDLIKIAESVEAQEIPKPQATYRPTWLPEGYSQSLVPELEDQVNVLYTSDAGPMILFAYSNNASSLQLHIPQEETEFFKVMVNDTSADFYLDNDTTKANCLVWESPENDLIYWIAANLTMDDMIKIAESVQEVPKQEVP